MNSFLHTPRFGTNSTRVLWAIGNEFLKENPIREPWSLSRTAWFPMVLATFVLLLGSHPTRALNILVNPGFEANSGHVVPNGWTRFARSDAQPFGNYWVEGNVPPQAGLLYYKEWGASYNGTNNNAAGIYQDVGAAAGNTYQASGYFFINPGDALGQDCYVWIDVSFLGSSSNLLGLYKSDSFNATVGLSNWFQYSVTSACDIRSPVSIGDPNFNTYAVTGTVSQLVAPAGTTKVRYRFVYVQSGAEGGSCYFDSAVLNQTSGTIPPSIANLFPLNMIFVNPSDGMSFNATSPSGNTINSNSISVVLNGVNITSSLSISGTSSNKTVTYHGLQSNTVYNASITVTDALNFVTTANTYFETTWVGIQPILYLWEAEDFDFNSGKYWDHPILCNTAGTSNCYYGTVGVEGTDEFANSTAPNHIYRPSDDVGTIIAGDYARKDHYVAGLFDYRVDPMNLDMWLSYTRDWSNGTYWVVGRLSTDIGLNGTLTLSTVTASATNDVGTFTINGGQGWSTFENIYLKDTNNNNALLTLNGKQTLRVTSGGNLLPNFFALVLAVPDQPNLSKIYPTGTHPFEPTNALIFTANTLGSTFPANGIRVTLDGLDVSASLVFSGSSSNRGVLYPNLLPNAIHQAIISVTNALGHGILITNNFDTFTEQNYFVEAEDYDYDGGQYIDTTIPDSYGGQTGVTNIDFYHTPLANENSSTYRPGGGLPQDFLGPNDYLRTNFQQNLAIDYVLTFFAGGDWANYTHMYPAGSYYVYIRTSGDGPFSMYLDQVVSGATTTNQITRRFGQFAGIGKNYTTYQWVPLTDNGLAAPVVVTLNGLTTLRLTTAGNCNPNYFMLVPTSGIKVTATRSGGNVVLSIPTQNGVNYRVFYRTDVSNSNWTLLTTLVGNGSVKTVTDPSGGPRRFYKVTAP
jgi:hypothetical protein